MGIFPKNDSFQEFTTHYGERLASYMRHRPWVTAGDGASGFSIPNCIADLHNGYSTSFNIASFQSQFDSGSSAPLASVLWRQAYLLNTRAGLIFRFISFAGATVADDFRWAGVCARVSGGSYTDTTGQQSIRDTTGYWLLLAHLPGDTRFILLRVVAGVVTLLAQKVAASSVLSGILTGAHSLQMEVTTESGNVRINTFYDGAEAVSSHLDSGASRILTSGRAGFGMCRDRQLSTPTRSNATLASRFNVFDMTAGTTLLADDFTRVNTQANPTVQDENGVYGKVLMSMWTLDIHGPTPWTSGSTQYRDPGLDRIDARGGNHSFSQIAAEDPIKQARSVWFRRTANVAYATNTGIILRGSMSNTGTAFDGYLMTITYVGAVYSAAIRRFNSGVTTLLAIADVTTDYGIVNGTDFQLLCAVETIGGITNLTMTVNGSLVRSWTIFAPGVTAAGAAVLDAGANAIPSGPAQAIQIIPYASTADGHIYYRLWTDEVPPATTDDEEENEPSIVIGSEVDGKTGTHSMPIGSEFDVEDAARVVPQTYESRHVARVVFDARTRRLWKVHVSGASQTERQDLWTFWDAHGTAIPFDFVNPESKSGELIPGHFLDDSLETARSGPITSDFQYVVEELFANETIKAFVVPTRAISVTRYRPSLTHFTPPTRGILVRGYPPAIFISFVPTNRAITVVGHPPTAP